VLRIGLTFHPTPYLCPYPLSLSPAAEEVAAAELAAAGGEEVASEELKALLRARSAVASARAVLVDGGVLASVIPALAARRIAPPAPTVKVLEVIWALLGVKREALGDPLAPEPTATVWDVARSRLDERFIEAFKAFDAEAPAPPNATTPPYARADALRAAIEAISAEDAAKTEVPGAAGIAIPTFLAWARTALDARDAAAAKRARDEEEAEAKRKAEDEAAAAEVEAAADGEAAEEE
jgi:hypothetical protein